jgi:hypothetical protein
MKASRILVTNHPAPFYERPTYGFVIHCPGKGRKALRRAVAILRPGKPLQRNEQWNPRFLRLHGAWGSPSHKLPKPALP